jgi:beta-galactosidase/beta-glucuronidase
MIHAPDPARGYPRPQLERDSWISLNGTWEFAFGDARNAWPPSVRWTDRIQVPFSPEAPLSGIGDTGFHPVCWYRRGFETPDLLPGERLLLHFGAVDYVAVVWMNGRPAGRHVGGYVPWTMDITDLLEPGPTQTIVLRADDDPADLAKPRGKQDWQLEPHSIWYPRTSGIWQTVWLEIVPATRIGRLRWTSNLERWELGLDVHVSGAPRDNLSLSVELRVRDTVIARDRYSVISEEVHRRIALSDPGIDDYRNELLWSPETPTIVEGVLELWADRAVIDRVRTYTALRSVHVDGHRFLLNGRPYMMRLVLDQGYWPDGGLTAPDDDALRRDVELARAMGFNGVRKHQKVEDPRFLYWADRVGLLVWAEMPSAYRFTVDTVERLTQEWTSVVHRDCSHPCIVAWVPFNESWGVPNLPQNRAERDFVAGLYHLTRALDPSRPVIGNDGWESVATDIMGVHDYDADPARLQRRYQTDSLLPRLIRHERPAGRRLTLSETEAPVALVLSEFGGLSLSDATGTTWGYSTTRSATDLATRYGALLDAVRGCDALAGFCYTQFADTYQEANGLLHADRTPKIPLDTIAVATGRPRALDAAGADGAAVAAESDT